VRQYLALAMGRTGRQEFFIPLTAGLDQEKEENLPAIIYALGMLRDERAIPVLGKFTVHANARIRSLAVVALGNMGDVSAKEILKKTLNDVEPNVQWGAAISLAKMGDASGKDILLKLLDRQYLSQFAEVDQNEENSLLIAAIEACGLMNDPDLNEQIKKLSLNDQNMKVRAAALEKINKLQ
jgi:HEAT repeat protein